MFFVKVHKPYRGQADELLIRGDLILEVGTRRQSKKAAEYDDTKEEGVTIGAWLLVDRIGWTPCIETPGEVAEAILTAEVQFRLRLEAARAARDTPGLPQDREHEGPAA